MFHFFEAITNTKGDALIGYYVKATDRDTGDVIDIYADNNATPIVSVSGVDNAALVDSDGNASFYVTVGTYNLDIYATDSTTFVRTIQNIPMTLDIDAVLTGNNTGDQFTATTASTLIGRGSAGGAGAAEEITLGSGLSMSGTTISVSGGAGGALVASNNLSDVADAATARDNLGVPSDAEMTAAIAAVASGNPNLTAFVSGGQAIWDTGFTYKVTAATYYINGTLYTSAEQSITLDAADGTFDRIDVIALDNTGTVQKITGTAAAAPSEPDIDPATQIEVTFVTVATGTTAPATAANENVYLEDAEWTTAVTGTHITKNSTNNPRTGTKCIEATSAVTGDSILLNKGSTVSPSAYTAIVFYIRNKTASWGTTQLRVHFQNASGTRVGNIVTVSSAYGFSTANTSSYQAVSIPLTAFAIPATALLQKFNIAVRGSTAVGWYIDDMVLQLNGAGTGSTSGLTQTQADARYAQRSANLSDLQSASTALTNLGVSTFAKTILDDADAAAVRSTIGISSSNVKLTESFIIACSDESTAITTGTAKATFRMPYAFTVTDVRASVNTAPTGSTILIDINEGGTTILSTKLMIDASEKTSTTAATPAVISDASLADDAEITIDFDQVGSTIAGKGVKVAIIGTRT